MKKSLLAHISVRRETPLGPPLLEPACVVVLKNLKAITNPDPTYWIGVDFCMNKKNWPTLQRWFQESFFNEKTSEVIISIKRGKEYLPHPFECRAILKEYEIDQWDRPNRPDLIDGSLFMHILSSREFTAIP